MFGSGLSWGLAWWLPGLHPPTAIVFINLLLLTGLVAGSTVTNFWIPWGSRLFALPILTALGVYLFSLPTDSQLIGGLMILLFWVTVDLSAQAAHQGYRDNTALTVEAERITVQLNNKNQTLAEEIERRKQAEQMIQTDREELLLVIDSIPVFTAIVTSDLVLRRINRALGEQLGVESEGTVSISLLSLVGPEQYATLKTRFEQTLTGSRHSFPLQLSWNPDRQQHFYSAHCIPIRSLGEVTQREFILLLEDVTTLKRSELRMHHAAFHDPLTGLGNRRLLDESLLEALDRTHMGEPGILILLDLDGFKAINDREGHPVGDTVLVAAARALTHSVRKADTICRLGGDEFAIVLPSAPRETAEQIAQKIQTRIHEETTPLVRMSAPPTASIGLVALEIGDIKPEDWITAADRGLYEAKRRGGNTQVWGHLSTP
ncbi:MAG: GGDEF domain-containing protein [Gammaproteobacteria bacterium]